MRIWIQVMHISFRFTDSLNKRTIKKIFLFFFMLKLNKHFRDEEIFDNLYFFNSSDLGGWAQKIFLSVFCWYFDPWIRIRGSAYFLLWPWNAWLWQHAIFVDLAVPLKCMTLQYLCIQLCPWNAWHCNICRFNFAPEMHDNVNMQYLQI